MCDRPHLPVLWSCLDVPPKSLGSARRLAAHAWAALSCIMAMQRLRTERFHQAWPVGDSQEIVGNRFLSILAVGIFVANISTLWDSRLAAGSHVKP